MGGERGVHGFGGEGGGRMALEEVHTMLVFAKFRV